MGLLDDLTEGDVKKIHTNLLDLENANVRVDGKEYTSDYSRALKAVDIYKYYCRFFNNGLEDITFRTVAINSIAPNDGLLSLNVRFVNNSYLKLGCTEKETQIDVTQGIYGRPWLGEVFYSDSSKHRFDRLYTEYSGTEALIINCGGYRGGGTAATFIPLENKYNTPYNKVHRYAVISGPSTKFECVYMIPFPEIYPEDICEGFVDIFDVPELITKLSAYTPDDKYKEAHEYNLNTLQTYASIGSENQEIMMHLNPALYASRFIDMLYSDSSAGHLDGIFINIKTDGNKLLDYDVTSREYQPKEQDHRLHVSNLVNAVSIKEILVNHKQYDTPVPQGAVYSFGTTCGDTFSPYTLFEPKTCLKYNAFLIMAVLIIGYVYPLLAAGDLPYTHTQGWRRGLFEQKLTDVDTKRLANGTSDVCSDFTKKYLLGILMMLDDIARTSNQSEMIPDKDCFEELINRTTSMEKDYSYKFVIKSISYIVMSYKNIGYDAAEKSVSKWLSNLNENLPNGAKYVENERVEGESYFKNLVKDILNQVEQLLG